MLQLRHYQEQAVTEGIFEWFAKNPTGNPIIALPGGTGKSLVIAETCRRALAWYPQTRILIATHIKELVAQSHAELVNLWPTAPCGIYSAGLKRRDTHLPITFVGIASVVRRIEDFGHIDLLLVDECDLISHREGTMYRKAIEALKIANPKVRVVGLSATPFRIGMGMLTDGDVFSDISCDWTSYEKFNQLVDEGYICPLVPKKTDTELSVEGVHIVGGEFVQHELQEAVDKDGVTRAALTEDIRAAHDRKHWVVFCTGVKHCDHTRDILHQLGVSAVSVHSELPGGDAERDANIAAFKRGEVRAMVSVNVVSRGFNFRPIDCLIILRPSTSAAWWIQALCRGTRPSLETGKLNCLVMDHAGNTRRLGPINDCVIPKKKGSKGSGMVPFRICPVCQTYCHTRVRFCPECGYEYPETVNVAKKASDLELIKRHDAFPPPLPKPAKPVTIPIVEVYKVDRIECSRHRPKDLTKPISLKVSFVCGVRLFNQWLCFEHSNKFAKHKAHEAWKALGGSQQDVPATVDTALERSGELLPPVKIKVLRGKYDEVVEYDFTPVVDVEQGDPF